MSTLQEIKAAIPKLTLEERAEVARCLHGWEEDEMGSVDETRSH